jgi:hypothetical protein
VAAVAIWILPIVVVAFIVRTTAIAMLRKRRPDTADAIDRWWIWAPLAVVVGLGLLVLVAVVINAPLLGIALTVLLGAILYYALFSDTSIGSPFRPRRRD